MRRRCVSSPDEARGGPGGRPDAKDGRHRAHKTPLRGASAGGSHRAHHLRRRRVRLRGLKAGAKGYLLKDTPPEELVSAIEKASRDETVLGGQIAARVISELRRMTDLLERTPRPEDDVLSGRRWRSRSSGAGALPTGRYPSPLHHRRNRQEPHLEDPQEAGSQGSHPTSALRRRTGMDEARPIAGTSISRSA